MSDDHIKQLLHLESLRKQVTAHIASLDPWHQSETLVKTSLEEIKREITEICELCAKLSAQKEK